MAGGRKIKWPEFADDHVAVTLPRTQASTTRKTSIPSSIRNLVQELIKWTHPFFIFY
jgi:hypothetical protein